MQAPLKSEGYCCIIAHVKITAKSEGILLHYRPGKIQIIQAPLKSERYCALSLTLRFCNVFLLRSGAGIIRILIWALLQQYPPAFGGNLNMSEMHSISRF
jgi:hypothetical protein